MDEVGADDPWVKTVLAGRIPSAAAHHYLDGTKLADPAVRKALLEGGQKAVDASTDPLIVLARSLYSAGTVCFDDSGIAKYRRWNSRARFTSAIITGTSTNGPITVANAAP